MLLYKKGYSVTSFQEFFFSPHSWCSEAAKYLKLPPTELLLAVGASQAAGLLPGYARLYTEIRCQGLLDSCP
jgi:hypothetical protein